MSICDVDTVEEKVAHEDSCESPRRYQFTCNGQSLWGSRLRTLCGKYYTICEDDPEYDPSVWAMNQPNRQPTCPECVQQDPYAWPGMLLVVRGGLGIPQIVEVTNDFRWLGVYGIGRNRIVRREGKTILRVLRDGDVFTDIGREVKGGRLVELASDEALTGDTEELSCAAHTVTAAQDYSTEEREQLNILTQDMARLAHEIWSEWIAYLVSQAPDGKIPQHVFDRWQRQAQTPYQELSGSEQESDLSIAQRYITCIIRHQLRRLPCPVERPKSGAETD